MAITSNLFFNADSIPSVKWLRVSTSFVLFKFTTVKTLISASTLSLLWKTQNHCSVIEHFHHQRQQHCLYFRRIQKRKPMAVICQVHMHAFSLAKSGFRGEWRWAINLPELQSSNVVYLQNARFIKMTLYLQKKGQLLELGK